MEEGKGSQDQSEVIQKVRRTFLKRWDVWESKRGEMGLFLYMDIGLKEEPL